MSATQRRDEWGVKSANKEGAGQDVDDADDGGNRRRHRRRTKVKPSRFHLDDIYDNNGVDDYGSDYEAVYDGGDVPDVDDYGEDDEADKRDYEDYLKSVENEGSGTSQSNWVNRNFNLIPSLL